MANMKYDVTADGCHIWQRATNSRGYGVVWHDGKVRLAHRVAWYLAHGRWPNPEFVLDHSCDVKACVNPAHLREMENWRNVRRAVPRGDTETERRRAQWRRANAKRRGTYTYTEGGE